MPCRRSRSKRGQRLPVQINLQSARPLRLHLGGGEVALYQNTLGSRCKEQFNIRCRGNYSDILETEYAEPEQRIIARGK